MVRAFGDVYGIASRNPVRSVHESSRNRHRQAASPANDICDPVRSQLLPSLERHDAGASARHLSVAEGAIPSQLCGDRSRDVCVSGDGVDPSAGRRHLCRQEADAVFAPLRNGLHFRRPHPAFARAKLWHATFLGRRRRSRLVRLPSGILARRTHGVGWAARPRASALSGGRQYRLGARAAHCGLRRDALGAKEHRLVLVDRAPGHLRALECRGVVQDARSRAHAVGGTISGRRARSRASADRLRDRDTHRAHLLEVHLSSPASRATTHSI